MPLFDSATQGGNSSFSHTTSGSDRALFVHVTWEDNGFTSVRITDVTYAGVSMELVAEQINYTATTFDSTHNALYKLANPALGTNTATASFDATPGSVQMGVVSLTDCNQDTSDLTGTPASSVENTDSISVSVPSASDDLVLDAFSWFFGEHNPGTGQTESYNDESGSPSIAGSTKSGEASSTSMSWSDTAGTATDTALIGVAVKPSGPEERDATLTAQAQDATASASLDTIASASFSAQAQNATASADLSRVVDATLSAQAQDATASITLDAVEPEVSLSAQAQDATTSFDLIHIEGVDLNAQAQDATASFTAEVEQDLALTAQAQNATVSLVAGVESDLTLSGQAQDATASVALTKVSEASFTAQADDATASVDIDLIGSASFTAQAEDATASADVDNIASVSTTAQAQNATVSFDLERRADAALSAQAQDATASFNVNQDLDTTLSAQAQSATASISANVDADITFAASAQAASTDIQVRHELELSFAPQARDATTSFNTFVIRSSQPSVIRKVSEVKAIPEPVERFFEKPGAYQYFLDLARTLKQFQSSAADDLSTKVTGSQVYPIGSVYINNDDDTDPADLLGYGTWSKLGQGEIISGVSATNSHVWKRTD